MSAPLGHAMTPWAIVMERNAAGSFRIGSNIGPCKWLKIDFFLHAVVKSHQCPKTLERLHGTNADARSEFHLVYLLKG